MSKNQKKLNDVDIVFQVIDWDHTHEETSDGDNTVRKYVIRMYGTTKENKKIFVKVTNFTPYFYVEIPKHWKTDKIKVFIDEVKRRVAKDKTSLKSWDVVEKHSFEEFTNYKLFKFVRFVFHDYEGFKSYERVFYKPLGNRLLSIRAIKYRLFESNIDPVLRFMHHQKLNSCGWAKLPAEKYNIISEKDNPSTNEVAIQIDWTKVEAVEDNSMVPLIIAAYDIECYSGDGSFPQPQRDTDKIIQIGTT